MKTSKNRRNPIAILAVVIGFVLMLVTSPVAFAAQSGTNSGGTKAQAKTTQSQQPTAMNQQGSNNSQKSATNKGAGNGNVKMTAAQSHSEILSVQKALDTHGYGLKKDGILGPNTTNAIMRYQKKNGLKITGQPDKATLAKLGVTSS